MPKELLDVVWVFGSVIFVGGFPVSEGVERDFEASWILKLCCQTPPGFNECCLHKVYGAFPEDSASFVVGCQSSQRVEA